MTARRLIMSLTAFAFLILSSIVSQAQHTTRRQLKPLPVATEQATCDTIFTAADTAALAFSGYEKTLRSTKETFYVTNRTDSSLSRIVVKIDYYDMLGRLLDSRSASVAKPLPPRSTRRVDLRSWDTQRVMYYHLSPKPQSAQATPYKVTISLVAALK